MSFDKMNMYWTQQPIMPRPQGNPGWNQGWGAVPQNAGGQGYTTPGYPPQGFGQQQSPLLQPTIHQSLPNQGYPFQQYAPQGYNQGFGGQIPVQHAWEKPKKGGIKEFLSNLMAKRKR
ncbi:hypothetical protein [Desulfosporosinus sp.]|uniref:hypothetical protein n=1 Tax=Desulfosporosinus sp. TaxID=157907 RepID=UPI000E9CFBD6|nr:hypothetical protein [Desulfosporosinus sp.]MBC2724377.1 hypothetical protein [Desulfosporosinus sp.]MBC2727745.1 hypothetical protein [Desulfosporosinus sp.]HBV85187.1 hypothetical protein [Desulfosporosinus sp.]